MDIEAKRELARAIMDTYLSREDSFDTEERRYLKSYWETAKEVVPDPDLQDLIPTMLAWSREHLEWAEMFLEKHKEEEGSP